MRTYMPDEVIDCLHANMVKHSGPEIYDPIWAIDRHCPDCGASWARKMKSSEFKSVKYNGVLYTPPYPKELIEKLGWEE